jgi:hypothetical protein
MSNPTEPQSFRPIVAMCRPIHFGVQYEINPWMEGNIGRNHNTYGFSMWLAGGGFKGGYVHGATDEWGHRAVENVVNHYDYHATVLPLYGLDHTRLSYKSAAQEQTLTDGQPGKIVKKILA